MRLKHQQRPQDLARLTAALHRWFAGDAEPERLLTVWIREYLLRDLRPELDNRLSRPPRRRRPRPHPRVHLQEKLPRRVAEGGRGGV